MPLAFANADPDPDFDIVADVLIAFEAKALAGFSLTPLAVKGTSGDRACILLVIAGQRIALTPAEARLAAQAVGEDSLFRAQAKVLATALRLAVDEAQDMLEIAVLCSQSSGGWPTRPRDFSLGVSHLGASLAAANDLAPRHLQAVR